MLEEDLLLIDGSRPETLSYNHVFRVSQDQRHIKE